MVRRCICLILPLMLFVVGILHAQNYSLPYPPQEFFQVLARTEIPCGPDNCGRARQILEQSVMIPASLTVNLYKAGRIYIGDARALEEILKTRIVGALILPVDKVDFMELKPLNKPIALY